MQFFRVAKVVGVIGAKMGHFFRFMAVNRLREEEEVVAKLSVETALLHVSCVDEKLEGVASGNIGIKGVFKRGLGVAKEVKSFFVPSHVERCKALFMAKGACIGEFVLILLEGLALIKVGAIPLKFKEGNGA